MTIAAITAAEAEAAAAAGAVAAGTAAATATTAVIVAVAAVARRPSVIQNEYLITLHADRRELAHQEYPFAHLYWVPYISVPHKDVSNLTNDERKKVNKIFSKSGWGLISR